MRLGFPKLLGFSLCLAACAVGGVNEPPPDEGPPDPIEQADDDDDDDEAARQAEPEELTAASFGVTALSDASGWSMLIAAVSEPGIVGCALVQEGADTPAVRAARIRVRLDVGIDGASSLCPEGTYALRNDTLCTREVLASGCAVYERWNDEGEPVVELAAAGGAVEIRAQLDESGFESGCEVELDLRFAGKSRFAHTFEFAIDPFHHEDSTCIHDQE